MSDPNDIEQPAIKQTVTVRCYNCNKKSVQESKKIQAEMQDRGFVQWKCQECVDEDNRLIKVFK